MKIAVQLFGSNLRKYTINSIYENKYGISNIANINSRFIYWSALFVNILCLRNTLHEQLVIYFQDKLGYKILYKYLRYYPNLLCIYYNVKFKFVHCEY